MIPIRNATTSSPDDAWRWRRLLDAPHRLAFFAGSLLLALTGVWWAAVMLAQALGLAWPWAVPAAVAHGLVMSLGLWPLFFAGFLFTAGPKWLGQPPVEASLLRWPIGASLAGWLLFIVGVHVELALAVGGVALAAAGLAALTLRFGRMVCTSRSPDRLHAALVLLACGVGTALLAAAAAALALQRLDLVRVAVHAGLWGFIGLVFVSVVHRMLPFFSAAAVPGLDAWRPRWLLGTLAAAMLAEAALAAADLLLWPLPVTWRAVQALAEAGMAALLLWLALRWGLLQSLKIRLLAMLHMGFVWLGLAFALAALSHGLMAATDGARSLGLAPVHALAAGFFGSTLLAMATRVSAGHAGRALHADAVVWSLFWLLQLAVVARVTAALWVAAAGSLLPIAALAWAAATTGWAWRHARWWGRPRADGQAG